MENSQQPKFKKDLPQAYRTAYLIAGFLRQTLTGEEKVELDAWIEASEENMILFEKMTDEKNLSEAAAWFKDMDVEQGLAETNLKIKNRRPVSLWTYAVAAAVIVLIIAGIYFIRHSANPQKDSPIASQDKDIMPGSDKAILTLDNGTAIELGNAGADTSINDQLTVLRKNGELVYSPGTENSPTAYHLLTVPRKGQYKVVLPDGTKVWVNAESSIRYPVAFTGNERKVFVKGEAFFEVAKNKDKPFRVVSGDVTVEALGTQFNVNFYENEPFVSATLVEGSVRVSRTAESVILKPGEQAVIMSNEAMKVQNNLDTAAVIAWKENQFRFVNTTLDEILRQVERWYDADVEYKDKVDLHLNATIGRDVPVSKLLEILEQTNQVHFKIEGKKIIVMK